MLNMLIVTAQADSKLTLASLEKQNYKIMTGIEISEILFNKTIKIKDLLSDAIYKIKIDENGLTKRERIAPKNPKILTSVEYNSRPALLKDSIEFSIKGNKIINTDGIRTYISTLYKKHNKIYGVRDIDNNVVNFQIIIEDKNSKK